MFTPRLKLRSRGGVTTIGLPAWLHVLYFAMAAVFGIASFGFSGREVPVLGVIITILCLFEALYDEQWVFDSSRRRVVNSIGLPFWARKKTWSFDDIASVRLETFAKGSQPGSKDVQSTKDKDGRKHSGERGALGRFRKPMATLSLVTLQDERLVIECTAGRHADSLRNMGHGLARELKVTWSEA